GFGVALLGILQVRANLFKILAKGIELLAHAGQVFRKALGVFFDLHAAQAHADHAEMRVQGIGRNGDNVAAAAVGVNGLPLGIHAHQQFVINRFAGNEHQREVQRAFIRDDVFARNGIGVAFDGGDEGFAGFVALGVDAAVGVKRELGIHSHHFLVA